VPELTIEVKRELRSTERRGVASPRLVVAVWMLALIACTWGVFAQVVTFEFLNWDDLSLVVPYLKTFGGLTRESITWAFTNSANGWRTPVPYLSLLTDAELFGFQPGGYHLTNLLVHTASTLVLFDALRRMSGAVLPSALAALLFAIHPLHVEPVAWVTGRWDLLCGFFWILGMWAYAHYCRRPNWRRYLPLAGAFVLAVVSKPMALTFPFALLLLDYWPLRRFFAEPADPSDLDSITPHRPNLRRAARLVVEKLPLFAIAAAGLWITFRAKSDFLVPSSLHAFSWGERIGNGLQTYVIYAFQLFWPARLSFYYPHPVLFDELTWPGMLAAGLVVAGATVASIALARRSPYFLVGWFWYIGVFVPAIGLLQVEHHARADRYTYLPLIGLLLVVCWSGRELAARLPRWRIPLVATVVAGVACLMIAASQQTAHWRDSRSLFTYAVRVDRRNFKATAGLGQLASREGDYKAAERWFRATLALLPGESVSRNLLGRALYFQGKKEQAAAEIEKALQIDPNLHLARRLLAIMATERGDTQAAWAQYQEILRYNPDKPDGYLALGRFLARQGDYSRAVDCFRRALELHPPPTEAPTLLGSTLVLSGRGRDAVEFYESFVRKYPHRFDVANELAWLLATHPEPAVRNGDRAVKVALQLCRQSGFGDPHALDTLAAAYAEAGRFADATETAKKAIRLARNNNDKEHERTLLSRLDGYRHGRPYRETYMASGPQKTEPVTTEDVR